MNTIPKTSIIVPVYNTEKFIGRCLRSALNQSVERDDYEIIVINDASTDRTAFSLDLFADEIRLIEHTERKGLPACLNAGIRAARGQFVVRLDADDYVHREYLNILMLHLLLNPGLDAVSCDYLMVDDDENIIEHKNSADAPIGCGIMFRIEDLIEIGAYDEAFTRREDEDLRLRFLVDHTIQRVHLPLYRYRQHDNNMSTNVEQMDRFARALRDKHGETGR